MRYSDFIVYVDESGDHSLRSINPRYPLFVLAMCVMHKRTYVRSIAPSVRSLKFQTFGHDMVVLHESDIRKRTGSFAGLGREACEAFMESLANLIEQADFEVIATTVDKTRLKGCANVEVNAYHLALSSALDQLFLALQRKDQQRCIVHVVCEARGAKEDAQLSLEFAGLCDRSAYAARGIRFELVIADKKTNSEGLQLADLTARPIGMSVLRPEQLNRAADIVHRKLASHIRLGEAHKAEGPQSLL